MGLDPTDATHEQLLRMLPEEMTEAERRSHIFWLRLMLDLTRTDAAEKRPMRGPSAGTIVDI